MNNAGVAYFEEALGTPVDHLDRTLAVNVRGTFNVCRSAARLLRGKGVGHHRKVVNMASVNGIYGLAANANYSLTVAPGTLTIGKAPLAVAAAPQTMVYGAALPAFTFTP